MTGVRMSSYPPSFGAMFAAWNERDMSKVRAHLEQALSPEVEFIDPTIITRGIDAFEQSVREFRTKYPEADIRRSATLGVHHQLYRYSWEISVKSKVFLVGMDVTETDAQGRVMRVLGFFGPLPSVS
ncbi:MAG: nuclear transport factor 2 family protein [Brachymonas sp.]